MRNTGTDKGADMTDWNAVDCLLMDLIHKSAILRDLKNGLVRLDGSALGPDMRSLKVKLEAECNQLRERIARAG